jgi:hypothetical protein
MSHQSRFKLGKLAARRDPRNLKYKSYAASLPPPPLSVDWTKKVPDWGMYLNDQLGICTIAAVMHDLMLWSSLASTEFIPTDAQALEAYSAITGYTPTDSSTDTGACESDVLSYWKETGIAGKKISAYVSVNQNKLQEIKSAIALFGAVYAGVQLPDTAEDEFQAGKPWDNLKGTIVGGHAITLVGYTPDYVTCVTWGKTQLISYPWLGCFLDETHAVLSPDWISADNLSPSGFNVSQLQLDLNLLT